jgi:hypothetical protein
LPESITPSAPLRDSPELLRRWLPIGLRRHLRFTAILYNIFVEKATTNAIFIVKNEKMSGPAPICNPSLIERAVSEVKNKIGAHHQKVQDIEAEHVPFARKIRHVGFVKKLREDTRNVSKEDEEQKSKALTLGRSRLIRLHDVHRPGRAKRNDHDDLKYLRHFHIPFDFRCVGRGLDFSTLLFVCQGRGAGGSPLPLSSFSAKRSKRKAPSQNALFLDFKH